MKIQIRTSSYNARRYGRPYIAKIDFTGNPRGDATWGDWVGQAGDEGILVIDAEPGDIIMRGQKDNRGNNGTPAYLWITPGGELEALATKADAYRAWMEMQAAPEETAANPLAAFTDDELAAELRRRGHNIAD